ncbi:MAG: hypothetical protein FWG62_02860 [Proteobacteria bacterium]|nr:hypothetical protein [Pseudomonadota bacterium]
MAGNAEKITFGLYLLIAINKSCDQGRLDSCSFFMPAQGLMTAGSRMILPALVDPHEAAQYGPGCRPPYSRWQKQARMFKRKRFVPFASNHWEGI